MWTPDHAIKIGTNKYEGGLILNGLVAGQALSSTGVYFQGFQRTALTPIPSALFSIALVATEFATLQGICYLYKQNRIQYTSAIIFSEIAYLLPKITIVAALVFSEIMPLSTASLACLLLALGITREADKAFLRAPNRYGKD